ncbi:R3H and coiled-coil domain-containing protein 1, partial [Phaethon lepturus]
PAATLALRSMDGVFLSPNEDEFVGRIVEELEHFMLQGQHHKVLLFPPLSSRLRYLIHRTVDNVDLLSSFSVGEGWRRRTVICHSAVRLPSETSDQKPSSNPPRPQRPPQPWGRGGRGGRLRHGGEVHGDNSRACVGSGRIKRPPWKKPDKALYIPKAMRKKAEWGEQESPGKDSVNAGTAEGGKSFSELESQDQECLSVAQVERNQHQNSSEALNEPLAACELVPGADPSASEDQKECWVDAPVQNRSGKVPVAEEEDKERSGLAGVLWRELHLSAGDEEESAAVRGQGSLEDDCTAELFAEIVGYLTVKDISIEKISFDYSSYGDAQLSEGDFGHVTEIYDFSPSLKTEHLLEVFSDFHESGFKIQWVDDTHALGIFSSLSTASQALGRRYPSLKIRPLIHATKQSKIKALQRPKLLHLTKERPQTDTAVAKRLVTWALGLNHKQQGVSGTEVLLPESLDQE